MMYVKIGALMATPAYAFQCHASMNLVNQYCEFVLDALDLSNAG